MPPSVGRNDVLEYARLSVDVYAASADAGEQLERTDDRIDARIGTPRASARVCHVHGAVGVERLHIAGDGDWRRDEPENGVVQRRCMLCQTVGHPRAGALNNRSSGDGAATTYDLSGNELVAPTRGND